MTHNSRTGFALAASLAMWAPAAISMLFGRLDVAVGGLYYLGALAIAWVGTGFIMNLANRYRMTVNNLERAKMEIEKIERRNAELEEQRNRRSTDSDND